METPKSLRKVTAIVAVAVAAAAFSGCEGCSPNDTVQDQLEPFLEAPQLEDIPGQTVPSQ